MIEAKVGDRIRMDDGSEGVVVHIDKKNRHASIKRDDGIRGSGFNIPGFGKGWTESIGTLQIINRKWKNIIED